MNKYIACIAISSIMLLAACSNKQDANKKNFGAAINQYLDKKGELCLNLQKNMPIDVDKMDMVMAKSMKDGIANQMASLEKLGLVSSADVQVDAVNFLSGKPTGQKVTVKRYQLTDAGKKYYQEKEVKSYGLFKGNGKTTKGDICYGKMVLDEVVKWKGPIKFGDYQEASVIYTYKIADLADWAKNPDIADAFPYVAETVAGISKVQRNHAVTLTSEGWEPKGLDDF